MSPHISRIFMAKNGTVSPWQMHAPTPVQMIKPSPPSIPDITKEPPVATGGSFGLPKQPHYHLREVSESLIRISPLP